MLTADRLLLSAPLLSRSGSSRLSIASSLHLRRVRLLWSGISAGGSPTIRRKTGASAPRLDVDLESWRSAFTGAARYSSAPLSHRLTWKWPSLTRPKFAGS